MRERVKFPNKLPFVNKMIQIFSRDFRNKSLLDPEILIGKFFSRLELGSKQTVTVRNRMLSKSSQN